MSPKLYILIASPPARSVIVTAAAIGVQLDIIVVERDYLRTDEFLKLNPQHTVPVLVDGDIVIYDSHVISTYLIGKYAKDDLLYPRDLIKRAVVDQRLYYDTSVMFPTVLNIIRGIRSKAFTEIPNELNEISYEIYGILETYLSKTEWLAGDHTTVADILCSMTIKSLNFPVPYNSKKYPKLASWMDKVNALPYYSADKPYLHEFKTKFEAMSLGQK